MKPFHFDPATGPSWPAPQGRGVSRPGAIAAGRGICARPASTPIERARRSLQPLLSVRAARRAWGPVLAALILSACGGGGDSAAGAAASRAGPVIEQGPQSLLVREGEGAMFNVLMPGTDAADATPPRYQWRRDGADIPGATEAWLRLYRVSLADDGARYSVAVGNGVVSQPAVLGVVSADTELSWR